MGKVEATNFSGETRWVYTCRTGTSYFGGGYMSTPKRRNPKKAGRKTRYIAALHPRQAETLFLSGYTVKEFCGVTQIGKQTFYRWVKRHPKFRDAVEYGRNSGDEEVVRAAFKRAVGGYSVTETQKTTTADGSVSIKTTTRQLPPSDAAVKFWLTNRRNSKWRANPDPAPTPDGEDNGGLVDALRELAGKLPG